MWIPLQVDEAMLERERHPVEPRDATTIALLRPTPDVPTSDGTAPGATASSASDGPAMQTYVLRRTTTMRFAAGMAVFPGGGVSAGDSQSIEADGPTWDEWADLLGCSADQARGLVVAGVRETFEESGILLAGTRDGEVLTDSSAPSLAQARIDLEAHRTSLSDVLAQHDLILRTDLLAAWSRWITPAFETRRYDTRIFAAVAPPGQRVGSVPSEAQTADWMSFDAIFDSVEAGQLRMLPPTLVTCHQLAALGSSDGRVDVVAAARGRSLEPIEPTLRQRDGSWFLYNPEPSPGRAGDTAASTTEATGPH